MATTITLASTANASLAGSTLTLTAQGIGTASQDRVVAVVAMGNGTVTSMTIQGKTATIQAKSTNASLGVAPFAAICTALVSSGTTGDIVVNSTTVTGAMGFGVFAITTADSATSSASQTTAANPGNSLSVTIVNESSAKGIAGYVTATSSTGTITWTNATASFQNTATIKYGCSIISTSGSALTVSASEALSVAMALVAATFGSTVPQTAVSQDINEALTPPSYRAAERMVGY